LHLCRGSSARHEGVRGAGVSLRHNEIAAEAQQKVAGLLKVQEGFCLWVSEWARSNGKMPAPEQNPLKYLAQKFVHVWNTSEWLRGQVVKHGMGPPLILNV